MKVELKNAKINQSLSDETLCFSADIWIDGQKVGTAGNRGHGGQTDLHFDDRKVEAAFEAFCKAQPGLPPKDGLPGIPMTGDLYIDLMVENLDGEKQYRRWCKKHLTYRLKTDPKGQYRQNPEPYSPAMAAQCRKHYGDKLDEILNERFL